MQLEIYLLGVLSIENLDTTSSNVQQILSYLRMHELVSYSVKT